MVILALSLLNMEMMRFDSLRSGTSSEPSGCPIYSMTKRDRGPFTFTYGLFLLPQSVTADIKSMLYLPAPLPCYYYYSLPI